MQGLSSLKTGSNRHYQAPWALYQPLSKDERVETRETVKGEMSSPAALLGTISMTVPITR